MTAAAVAAPLALKAVSVDSRPASGIGGDPAIGFVDDADPLAPRTTDRDIEAPSSRDARGNIGLAPEDESGSDGGSGTPAVEPSSTSTTESTSSTTVAESSSTTETTEPTTTSSSTTLGTIVESTTTETTEPTTTSSSTTETTEPTTTSSSTTEPTTTSSTTTETTSSSSSTSIPDGGGSEGSESEST